jgi:hypothetical protein
MTYQEPILTVAVLDFCKPHESRLCLESVKRHLKVGHKIIFCDNGSGEDYPLQFVREGLVDQLIVNRESMGLGLGTRDLFAAAFGPVTLYLQNDQIFVRDFQEMEFVGLVNQFGAGDGTRKIGSISLAGQPCGPNIYSERAHLISTKFYKDMERNGLLGYHGAGKYHDGVWRERQIQDLYTKEGLVHWMPPILPWVSDNGVYALRDMSEGGVWLHRTDTKALWVVIPPQTKNPAYPKLTDEEFETAKRGEWVDATIPSQEVKDSFHCWDETELAKMEKQYVDDLRERFRRKAR